MTQRISRPRRFSRRIFLLLISLGLGFAAWWFGFRENARDREERNPPLIELFRVPSGDRPIMGTMGKIVLYTADKEAGHAAIEAAFQRGEEIAAICTDYHPESELMRLSRGPIDQEIPVSPTLAAVLAHARTTAELTEGAFDPTFGPLTKLWRRSKRRKELPNPDQLASARQAANWMNLEVDLENKFVVLKKEGMLLDLGGIAKGFAADEMMHVLNLHGIYIALVAIAGDIRLGAPPPGRTGWGVAIKTLGPDLEQVIQVANCAVSTSGDLNQFVEIDGVRYSHIIDPATGLGLTRRIAATVVAPMAVQSDPLATFCCIQPEQAKVLFQAGEISCRIVVLRRGLPVDDATPQFPPILAP
jgi:thiamine biosynthesis lipoprotein